MVFVFVVVVIINVCIVVVAANVRTGNREEEAAADHFQVFSTQGWFPAQKERKQEEQNKMLIDRDTSWRENRCFA